MKPYKNLSGNSSVKAFQIYGDGIKIQFTMNLYIYICMIKSDRNLSTI
jgi:hypothetical protein